MAKKIILPLLIVITLLIGLVLYKKSNPPARVIQKVDLNSAYQPKINPSEFVKKVDNPYFTLTPGKSFHYEKKSDKDVETVDVIVTQNTKEIMGVTTIEVRDTSKINGTLREDTKDWYAQDKEGNVWYFGEEVNNYIGGKIANHNGSWLAGVDQALPGIAMPANPQVGQTYRQEYYKGKAEDLGEVISLAESLSVPSGNYTNCLKTKDTSAIETQTQEYKYYCKEAGTTVRSESAQDPTDKEDLVTISN